MGHVPVEALNFPKCSEFVHKHFPLCPKSDGDSKVCLTPWYCSFGCHLWQQPVPVSYKHIELIGLNLANWTRKLFCERLTPELSDHELQNKEYQTPLRGTLFGVTIFICAPSASPKTLMMPIESV